MTISESDVGHALRAGLGAAPGGVRLARQRARLVQSVRAEPSRARRRRTQQLGFALAVAAGALLLATALLVTGQNQLEPPTLRATLGEQRVPEGGWIETEAVSERLEFTEGSSVAIGPRSKARLGRLLNTNADLMLEAGSLHARITKRTGVRWTISAGPYRVQVVGTEFDVEWDFSRERFSVKVGEGAVRVSGGDLPKSGLSLTAGQSLLRSRRAASEPAATEAAPAPVPAAATEATEETLSLAQPKSTLPRAENPAAPQTWQRLARDGSYAKALMSARRSGVSHLLVSLPPDDLLLLANTARYAGDPITARAAFVKIRERYRGHSAASLSAFSLGRLAGDVEGNPGEAARWFRIFLEESPRGDLAAGARARLMDTLLKLGDTRGAQAVARDYLNYHPNGPHSATARSLVGTAQVR